MQDSGGPGGLFEPLKQKKVKNDKILFPEMEKRKNIAQTHILDQKIAQVTRNSRHIIIHVKRA